MPINTRKSANYSGQKIKFKDLGLGGQMKMIDLPEPLLAVNVPTMYAHQFTFLSSSTIQAPVIYGGISGGESGVINQGYIWESGAWRQFNAPAEDSGLGRLFGAAGSDDGKLLLIGGSLGLFAALRNNSHTWNPETDSWSSPSAIPGATDTLAYEYAKGPAATNYKQNITYLWGGSDFPSGGPAEVWRDQLVAWDGSSWIQVNTDTTVPGKDSVPGGHVLSLAARGSEEETELMLFTGSFDSFTPSRDQAIFYWVQNSKSPISGTWSYVTGSTGDGEANNMPQGVVHLMWEENRSRWTAMSADPNTSPNIWVSSDSGLTWSSYTYSIGAWSNPITLNDCAQYSLLAAPDPERNKFYISCVSSEGPSGYQELWELNVASTPSDSTLNKLYP